MADFSLGDIVRRARAWRRAENKKRDQMGRDGVAYRELPSSLPARDREWLLGHIERQEHSLAALRAEVEELVAERNDLRVKVTAHQATLHSFARSAECTKRREEVDHG